MHRKLVVGAIAVAAIGLGVAALATTGSMTGKIADTAQVSVPTTNLSLRAMPVGTVTFIRDHGTYDAKVNVYGLTQGSPHDIEIDRPGAVQPEVRIDPITADAHGRVDTTVKGVDAIGRLAKGSTFVIRLGNSTSDFDRNALAAEVIATTDALPANPTGRAFTLRSVSMDTNGAGLGKLTGSATLAYDKQAKTLTIKVNATGLVPGSAHAAHIHIGTCKAQGLVNKKFMFSDLTADAYGNIANQTRVIKDVTAPPAAGSSYLNIHLGDMNSILDSNGNPTLSFRPLLCANI